MVMFLFFIVMLDRPRSRRFFSFTDMQTAPLYYRDLMTLLSPYYRVIAPDLPGFGFTTVDPRKLRIFLRQRSISPLPLS